MIFDDFKIDTNNFPDENELFDNDLNNIKLDYYYQDEDYLNSLRTQGQSMFGFAKELISPYDQFNTITGQESSQINPPIIIKSGNSEIKSDVIRQNLNSAPCITRTANSSKTIQSPNLPFQKRKRKRKIDLSPDQESFKNEYYKFFTDKKKFSKNYVIAIHNIIRGPLSLPKITRDQTRQIDLYFQYYAYEKDKIFDYISNHKDELSEKVFQ